MASASPSVRSVPEQPRETLRSLVVGPARFAGFWTSVALPFVLLGVLATGSLAENATLLGALLAANVVALRLGQGYKRA